MKSKRSRIVAGLSLSAALALSGAAVKAAVAERPCQAPGSGQAVSKVGKVVSINLLSGTKGYSSDKATGWCCGPYGQRCPEYRAPY